MFGALRALVRTPFWVGKLFLKLTVWYLRKVYGLCLLGYLLAKQSVTFVAEVGSMIREGEYRRLAANGLAVLLFFGSVAIGLYGLSLLVSP